jgi:hypothetical protein
LGILWIDLSTTACYRIIGGIESRKLLWNSPAGERKKSLIRDAKELAKDAKLLEKVAQSYEPHWWRSIHQEEMG